jgi:glycosyltransferase involved in cell wall biosynthesis
MGPVAALAASVHGLPFCVWAHGSDLLRYASKGRVAGFLARASLRRAAAVLAVSRELEERILRDPRVARERVSRLAMGVDPEVFGPRAAAGPGREELRRRLQCDRATLLFVGDLIEEKGLLDLLDARSRLEDEGLDVALVAAGDGPLRSVLEERARASPTRVRALGRVAQAELVSWYRAADALVLPSRSEGTPVSILEALSVGCPVVASRVGGIPDLFEDGVGGFLVEPGDAGGLSRCLGTAIRSGTFAVERRKLEASPPDHSASSRARDFRSIAARLLPEAVGGGAP